VNQKTTASVRNDVTVATSSRHDKVRQTENLAVLVKTEKSTREALCLQDVDSFTFVISLSA
jgi:HD superfamily phosphodiesterase